MPYHNDAQKQPNIYTQDTNYIAGAMSSLSYNMAHTLGRQETGFWTVDKHDGLGPKVIDTCYYDPDFLVENVALQDLTPKRVKIDLVAASELTILLTPGKDLELRVTRVYLDKATEANVIVLLA